jgi:hypothetical protein
MNQMVKFASHRFQGIAGRSNIERRTSNNVFCLFKKRLSNTRRKRLRLRPVSLREAYGLEALRERIYPSKFCGL